MPGGFTIMLLLPLVGFLLSRYSPRWLLFFGLVVLSVLPVSHDQLRSAISISAPWRWPVCSRLLGMAFLFVPINTAAYAICRAIKIMPPQG